MSHSTITAVNTQTHTPLINLVKPIDQDCRVRHLFYTYKDFPPLAQVYIPKMKSLGVVTGHTYSVVNGQLLDVTVKLECGMTVTRHPWEMEKISA